ncbi:hypothetical protein GJ496_002128 [Pomphorhynchus laevis]|nr:hypothetical protein GJ496_002128 [Pomphorhynchus laevis]
MSFTQKQDKVRKKLIKKLEAKYAKMPNRLDTLCDIIGEDSFKKKLTDPLTLSSIVAEERKQEVIQQ